MAIECLTYAELGARLGISPEAARKKVAALRLKTALGNDGRKRVTVDLAELHHTPRSGRRAGGLRPDVGATAADGGMRDVLKLVDALGADNQRLMEAVGGAQTLVHALQARICDLQAELAVRPSQDDVAKIRAMVADVAADRDAWRQQAQTLAVNSRPWWRRLLA